MEPTQTNKTKIIIIVSIVVVIVIVGLIFILKSKKEVPVTPEEKTEIVTVNPVVLENESKEINRYIDEATTFDNEASLAEIEKEF